MDQNVQLATQGLSGNGFGFFQDGKLNLNGARPFRDADGHSKIIIVNSAGQAGKLKINASALLRYDEWKDIDRTVIEAGLQRMPALNDLRSRGLTHSLGSIGQTVSMWETLNDMTPAGIAMSAITRGEKDTPSYGNNSVPVPIVFKEFSLELRRLEASRRFGAGLDVLGAEIAGRLVGERSEQMLFSGAGVQVDGATIYGYINHPNRNTVTLSENWDAVGKTGEEIIADVQAMLAAARADRYYGPYMLYIPSLYEGVLDNDYRANDDRTVRQRIMALSGIGGIQVADYLPANNVVMVQLTRDVVDLAIAQDITTVQWSILGGMQEEFKVMAVWVPRVKAGPAGQSGIVHLRA